MERLMNKSIIHIFGLSLLCIFVLNSCSKISLSPSPKANEKMPPLKGEWNVDFTYNDEVLNSYVEFNQSGNQVTGEGKDLSNGKRFTLVQGEINGDQIRFQKRYITSDPSIQPLKYSGKIEYLSIPEYKGWAMSGSYSGISSGQQITGNWEATPKHAGNSAPDTPPVAQTPQTNISAETIENNQITNENESLAPNDDTAGPDLSGRYDASYTFNFKIVHSKMWLEQDGHNIAGHGVDTNTNEKFTIEKGWYHFPNLTLVRKYIKGKDAASTRTVIFKATVSVNSHGPHLKGETQYGGGWEAQIIR
jgi:hypothetical protein